MRRLFERLGQFRSQLLLTYLPLALLPVLLVGLVTRGAAEQGLSLLVSDDARQRSEALAPCLADYYRAGKTWAGFQALLKANTGLQIYLLSHDEPARSGASGDPLGLVDLSQTAIMFQEGVLVGCFSLLDEDEPRSFVPPGILRGPQDGAGNSRGGMMRALGNPLRAGETTILTDSQGVVIASTDGQGVGQALSRDALAQSAPITVDEQVVGRLVVGAAVGQLNQRQQQLLNTLNQALLISGLMAVVLAVGLGWLMSWQVTLPLRSLKMGVARLGRGQWNGPLPVHAQDEFGELTRAFNGMANEIIHQQQLNKQMVADIAHDLRTPLATMALEVEAIEAGFQTPAEATDSLREEITWLQRMVEDLRMLSLIDADQLKLQTEEVALPAFLGTVHDFWLTMADEQQRCLVQDVPDDLPALSLDPGRMRQVLNNLMDNAIRHTRPGDKITLRARAEDGHATVQVIDEGEGIPPEALPHIFDRFYRVDPARRRSDGGSGLGLSIARRLVEMHGGSISASSQAGRGTTFTIALPLAQAG